MTVLRALFILGFASKLALGSSLRLDLRHHSSPISPNAVDQSALYDALIVDWLGYELGFNLALVTWNVFAIEYKGELKAELVPGVSAHLRLAHAHYFTETAGATSFSTFLSTDFPKNSVVSAVLGAGYFARTSRLDATPLLPSFSGDLYDANWMLRFGFAVRPTQTWKVALYVSTYDELHTYNLNNPFVSLDVFHAPQGESFEVLAYTRYRILLGFGRLSDFTVGAGLRWNFTPRPSLGS